MFVVFAAGARTVKMFYFARLWYHLKKACRLDNFRQTKYLSLEHAEKRPTCDWSRIDSWRYQISSENGGWNTETPALMAGAPSSFPLFRNFGRVENFKITMQLTSGIKFKGQYNQHEGKSRESRPWVVESRPFIHTAVKFAGK